MSCVICMTPVAAPAPAVCSSRCRSDADLRLRRLARRRRELTARIDALESRGSGWRVLLRRRPVELAGLRQELADLVPQIEVLLGVSLQAAGPLSTDRRTHAGGDASGSPATT